MLCRRNSRSADREWELDMTPMSDCMFQLLVYFLLTLSLGQTADDGPEAVTGEDRVTDPVLVTVAYRHSIGEWQYFVSDSLVWVSAEDLEPAIALALQDVDRRAVVIRCPTNCPWRNVQRVALASRAADDQVAVEFQVKEKKMES